MYCNINYCSINLGQNNKNYYNDNYLASGIQVELAIINIEYKNFDEVLSVD